jgi:hypothetical protein
MGFTGLCFQYNAPRSQATRAGLHERARQNVSRQWSSRECRRWRQNLSIRMRTTAANNCPRSTMQQLAPLRPVSNRFCADDRRPKADGVLSISYSIAVQMPQDTSPGSGRPRYGRELFCRSTGFLNAINRHRGALPGPGFRLEIRPPRVFNNLAYSELF